MSRIISAILTRNNGGYSTSRVRMGALTPWLRLYLIVDSTNDGSGRNTLIGYDNSEMPSFSAAIASVDDDEDEPQTVPIKKKPQNDVLQIKKPIIAPKPIAQAISQQPKSILTQLQNPVKNALKLIFRVLRSAVC